MNAHKIFNLVIAFVFVFSLFGVPAPVLATSQASVQSASFTTCVDVIGISQVECEALIALYNSTNGSGWVNNTDWLATDTPCSWYGVECGGGHVTKLRLGANQLSGSIPMELGNLTQLTELGLGANQLSGSIPMELGNLTQLTGLGLEFNQLTGSIPAELGNLAQLTWLNLAFNQLTGGLPTEIGGLTQLTGLYLFFNQLSGEFPSSITNLVNLTTLRYDCWLTSSDPVVIAFLNEKSAYQCAPNLQALPDQEQVSGENWTLGKTVTIEIDDPATQDVNPDHTGQAVVGIADWDPKQTRFDFFFIGEYNLKPGDLVTVSDNTTTKTHTVTSLAITNINPDTNMVSGTTNTSGSVDIWICDDNNCVVRKEPVDLNGNWSANFGEPGDEGGEEDTFDIQSYTGVDAAQYDQERDSTQVNWSVPLPVIEALGTNQLAGSGWTLGTSVTLTIDDPTNGIGVDYTAIQQPFEEEGLLRVPIPVEHFLKPGHIIQATDGVTTKTLEYAYIEITEVDTVSDAVYGLADAGTVLQVEIHDSGGIFLDVTADNNGIWTADFQGVFDLTPIHKGKVRVSDEDSDATIHFFGNPNMNVYLLDDLIQGLGWKLGSNVTLTIDDPMNGSGVDLSETKVVEVAWWNPSETEIGFATFGLGIRPGQLMVMTDGQTTITHVVSHLTVTEVSTIGDTVAGITDPGGIVEIGRICDEFGCAIRRVTANSDGDWLADFSVTGEDGDEQDTFDIRPGTEIKVAQKDNYGNSDSLVWVASDQPLFSPFVVLGQEGIWIKENSEVISGDVGANDASNGPYLTDQSEVTIGQHVRFLSPDSRVLGDTLYLKWDSQIYDVYYNEIREQGLILGERFTPLNLPVVLQMPSVPEITPGAQNFDLKKNALLTLDAGAYGKLEAKKGATITFTGGVYHFTEWLLGDNVKVYFNAPTEIRISGKLDIGRDAYIGPASGSDVTAQEIFIYVLGKNGNTGKIGATPKAAKFGIENTLFANVYAPNGTLWIREGSTAAGAFFGKWVTIGENVTLTLNNGWR